MNTAIEKYGIKIIIGSIIILYLNCYHIKQ